MWRRRVPGPATTSGPPPPGGRLWGTETAWELHARGAGGPKKHAFRLLSRPTFFLYLHSQWKQRKMFQKESSWLFLFFFNTKGTYLEKGKKTQNSEADKGLWAAAGGPPPLLQGPVRAQHRGRGFRHWPLHQVSLRQQSAGPISGSN